MRTMIKFSLPFMIALFLSPINYSQVLIGLQGGLSIPSIGGGTNELSEGYTSRRAPNFGIFMDIPLNRNFSIQTAINYNGQGGQRNGLQPITNTSLPPNPNGQYYYADFNNVSILNYLEIPVLLKYTWGGDKLKFQGNFGPYFGFLLNAKEETSGTSLIYTDKNGTPLMVPVPPDYQQYVQAPPQSFDATTNIFDSIHNFNFGAAGGIGIIFPFGQVQQLNLDIRFTYGFTNIQVYPEDGKNHTGSLVISLGYSLLSI
jgi:Outer membrane protein beta-barrel domain